MKITTVGQDLAKNVFQVINKKPLALVFGVMVVFINSGGLAVSAPTGVIATEEKTLDTDNLTEATSLNRVAELYRAQGQYDKAEPRYQRALAIREKNPRSRSSRRSGKSQ